jgi:D-beta-D-heptose 7-phosphate kinase/D-beta-D-heptose 1-phosphate adenosyltransferase
MKIVCVSGYFDPFHVGHLDYLENAKRLGDHLLVVVNNDEQAKQKKGKSFMPEEQRLRIVRALKIVDQAILSCDKNRTVCDTLRCVRPDIFANGGDQTNDSIPEAHICKELGIELVDGLGDKVQSSSWLIKNAQNAANDT